MKRIIKLTENDLTRIVRPKTPTSIGYDNGRGEAVTDPKIVAQGFFSVLCSKKPNENA
jgi:hypothetical protein